MPASADDLKLGMLLDLAGAILGLRGAISVMKAKQSNVDFGKQFDDEMAYTHKAILEFLEKLNDLQTPGRAG
jgi:hypothetical protein